MSEEEQGQVDEPLVDAPVIEQEEASEPEPESDEPPDEQEPEGDDSVSVEDALRFVLDAARDAQEVLEGAAVALEALKPVPVPAHIERLRSLERTSLPAESLEEALLHFRRPFSSAAVKYKVQSEWGTGALIVAYIDARLVIERLNLVWPWWDKEVVAAGTGALRCYLTLSDGQVAITRKTDVGTGSDLKTLESDALKRAAVHLGIGVSIYSLSQIKLKVGPADNELRTEERTKRQRDGSRVKAQVPFIDAQSLDRLRLGYERWLVAKGISMFGPVLDHGDDYDAQGLDTESPAAAAAATGGDAAEDKAPAPEPLQQIEGERADELRQMAAGVHAQLRQLKPRKLPPAQFQAKLQEAGAKSIEALETFVDELEVMVREAGGGGA